MLINLGNFGNKSKLIFVTVLRPIVITYHLINNVNDLLVFFFFVRKNGFAEMLAKCKG